MKKLFSNKKVVEFTADELATAQRVLTAMQDKNVEVVVGVNEPEQKKSRTKLYTFQTSVALTEEQEKIMKKYCKENNTKIATVMRCAFDEYMLNHAA